MAIPMIVEKALRTIEEHKLFEKKERVLIAYSGGADSTALLLVLLELCGRWQFELFLGHFNHRLRANADEDERFVRAMADTLRLPLFVGSEDVRSQAKLLRRNIEETGRNLRYEFLKKTAADIGAAKVATGHTMTDQAETFLMRLMRGAGLHGLAGIFPMVEGIVVRPLLSLERRELQAYLAERKADFRVDESNFDRRLLRNRIRLELLPYLEKHFDPLIVPRLSQLASLIRDEDAVLESLADEKAQQVIRREESRISLDVPSLSRLPRGLARRVVRRFIAELRGDLRGISFQDVEFILALGEGKERPLRKSLVLRREKDRVFVKAGTLPGPEFAHTWNGEGVLEIKEANLKLRGRIVRLLDFSRERCDDRRRAFMDLARLQLPLLVRNRRRGDRYHPLGAPGQAKLKEAMRARGIPRSERNRMPVLVSGDEIAWVLGLPVSETFKVRKKTTRILRIEIMEKEGGDRTFPVCVETKKRARSS